MTTTQLPVAPGPDTVGAIRTHAGNYIIPASVDGAMTCRDCGRTLPVTKFPTLPARADGIVRRQPHDNAQCRACRDARNVARKTGATFVIVNGAPTVTTGETAIVGADGVMRPFVTTPSYVGIVPSGDGPTPAAMAVARTVAMAADGPHNDAAHRHAARWANAPVGMVPPNTVTSADETDRAMGGDGITMAA